MEGIGMETNSKGHQPSPVAQGHRHRRLRSTTALSKSILGRVVAVAVTTGLAIGALSAAAPRTASAVASTIKADEGVRECTNVNDASCYAWTTLKATTGVTMKCWRDEGGQRWYWVVGPGIQGFVRAARVSSPTTVGYCDNTPSAYRAVRWAGSQLKQRTYTQPVTGKTIDSYGWCLLFVHDAWVFGGRQIGSRPRAIDFWNSPPSGTKVATTSTNAPVGALVFWKGTAQYPEGHVAISVGSGRAISTYEGTTATDQIHMINIATRNSKVPGRYLGWVQY
jgi:cell wall-associated NlpC family hydrolase